MDPVVEIFNCPSHLGLLIYRQATGKSLGIKSTIRTVLNVVKATVQSNVGHQIKRGRLYKHLFVHHSVGRFLIEVVNSGHACQNGATHSGDQDYTYEGLTKPDGTLLAIVITYLTITPILMGLRTSSSNGNIPFPSMP